jgi:diguanylate cyclase (GGDEF)-like protein
MDLDVRTLIWVNIVVAFAISALTYSFWSSQPTIRGLRGWSIGMALCGLGWLIAALRSASPSALMIIAPGALIAAGFTVVWLSIRRFNESGFTVRRVLLPLAIFAAIFAAAWLGGADTQQRLALLAFLVGVLTLLSGWELLRADRAERLRGRWLTAITFFIFSATMMARAALSLRSVVVATPGLHEPSGGLALFVGAICLVAITLGFLMMSNERLRSRYARLALTDELTELPNRRSFLEQGARLGQRARKGGVPASLLMMDLDHFSSVNERFGHAGGDQALTEFTDLLRRTVRPADLLCRYGGEEFCALLIGASTEEAARVAERIRGTVAGHVIIFGNQKLTITVSIGVASISERGLAATIQSADEALYQAKARGRNAIAIAAHDDPSERAVTRRMAM